jgi:PAS domain S-box-containing protein
LDKSDSLFAGSIPQGEEQYRLLFNTMLDGFALHEMIYDATGVPCDYRFLEINPSFERLTGLKAVDIIGKTVLEVLPDIDAFWISTYGEVALSGKSARFENYAKPLKKYFDVLAFSPRKNQFATIFTDITERRKAQKVQEAVYRISETSVTAASLQELYASIHSILGELMPVDNFYIALYDPVCDLLSFPYFVDQYDQADPPQKPGRGLTEYVIRTGNSLLASPESFARLVEQGEVELVGTDSLDWLGVPLKAGGSVFGALVTQSYTEGVRFRQAEKDLLEFVSTQVALAIHRKQTEEEIRRQLNRLAALREIDSAINSHLDMGPTLDAILAQTAAQLGIDAAVLLLLDPHRQTLEYVAGRGFRTQALQHTHVRLGDSFAGRAALSRQIVRIADLHAHPTDFLRSPAFFQEGFACYFGVPLIVKDEVKGVLELFHRSPLGPDPEWLDFLQTLAGQAAIAIDNRQLFANLQDSNLELMRAYDATIEGWSQAMDLRDRETEGHTLRVTGLAVWLAEVMGMSAEEIVHLRRGALLHDIGKLGVPDAILFKPGPLSEAEWAVMRQHPLFAYNMLYPIAYLRPALDIPYCHHEKWDGGVSSGSPGYPRGLKGEQIPLAARIFAVVDVWDAITSDRPYRRAWEPAQALQYIRDQSGRHFDPRVVAVFLRLLPEL